MSEPIKTTLQLDDHTAALIAQSVEEALEEIGQTREIMDARETAEFLRMPYAEFRRIASNLPRHKISDRRYVYIRKEVVEWLANR